MNVVVSTAVERYAPIAKKQKLSFAMKARENISMVKCDVDRIKQVIRSMLEVSTLKAWKGEKADVIVETRDKALGDDGPPFVAVSVVYPGTDGLTKDVLDVVNTSEAEWRDLQDATSAGTFNLSIGMRVVEAHGGQIHIASAAKKTAVQFTLAVA